MQGEQVHLVNNTSYMLILHTFRKWQYDTVELDGKPGSVRENQFLAVVKGSIATFKE